MVCSLAYDPTGMFDFEATEPSRKEDHSIQMVQINGEAASSLSPTIDSSILLLPDNVHVSIQLAESSGPASWSGSRRMEESLGS